MKKPLAVGDRVRVYGVSTQDMTLTGTVVDAPGESRYVNTVAVKLDHKPATSIRYHVKQCRRLVKRKRREFWINPVYLPSQHSVAVRDQGMRVVTSTAEEPGFVLFREVPKRGGGKA